jgi:hypothetical protein
VDERDRRPHRRARPFNGGTYVFVTVPATTSGGSATHSIVAVDNNGNTLRTVTP